MANSFCFEWKDISVTVTESQYKFFKINENTKHILENGKKGVLKINDNNITNKYMRSISGYTPQEDKFTTSLTIEEHMQFMTALKFRKSKEERHGKIKKLLTELCLEEHRHTIIASLSGGERRRLSLASELISDPSILFCDEPITGLDSFSALSVIRKLEAVAMTGKLVLVSVHQPSSQLFDLFDNLILLANGKLIFQGSKLEAKLFFDNASLHCPVAFNPADFYINCLSVGPDSDDIGEKRINRLHELYRKEYLEKRDPRNGWKNDVFLTPQMNENFSEKDMLLQLDWLIWREYIVWKRNFRRFWTTYLLLMITSLLLSVAFFDVKLTDPSSPQDIQGVLLLIVSEVIYTHMYSVIYVFPDEVHTCIWEKSIYSSFPYFISKVFSLIPMCLINSVSFILIYFAMSQFLRGLDLFLGISIILFTASFSGICFGLCLSAIFSTVEYVELFIVPFDVIVTTLSGIWIKIDTLPRVFRLVKYISPFYFSFSSISTLFWEKSGYLVNCTIETTPCYKNGEDVLMRYGFFAEYNVPLYNTLYMYILILAYCYIGYLGVIRKRALYEFY